jgi:Ribbon-helix-helix protein, copG family
MDVTRGSSAHETGGADPAGAARRVDPMTQSLADLIEHGPDAAMPVPDTSEPMVVKSLRLPLRLAEALEQEAAARGVGVTVLMRDLLQTALRDPAQQRYVPLEEAIALLSRLARNVPPAA